MSQFNFVFDKMTYDRICAELRLSLLQEVRNPSDVPKDWPHFTLKPGTLGGGKQTDSYDLSVFLEVAANTEGLPFVVLQPSYEDAQGILSMQDLDQFGEDFPRSLLTTKAVRALLMLDFWNPVYSWKRGVLMQYLPAVTNLVTDGRQAAYDLEAAFVSAVRASTFAASQDTNSPEHQFLQMYDGSDDVSVYQERVGSYLSAVNRRLQTEDGLRDYLKLAESRRRIYRPLPLDEFGVQLPYAVGLPVDWPYIEMAETGAVQPIPQRGLEFLASWTGTLHGFDPHIVSVDVADQVQALELLKYQ
ncbi:hypothetical protein N0V90_003430 [Neofusicoccum parvum]|nr:hypothetical protein N0V90_003430 [Neofusicoccum parvum]